MDPPMDGPSGNPTNKPQPVNKRASPQTKLFEGVRKLKADWTSNMPLSLGGGRSTNTAENKIRNSTAVGENQQTEGMRNEVEKEKDKGAGMGISSMNREELMGFCMKLIKRQKLLEERQSQSFEMHKFVADERAELLLLAKEVVGLPSSAPETDVPSLRAAWLRNKEGAVRSDGQNADSNGNEAEAIDSQVSRTPPPSQLEEELKILKQELVSRTSAYSELEAEHKTVKQELASRASPSQLEEELKILKQELVSRTSAYSELEAEHKTVKQELASRASPSQLKEELTMLKQELVSRTSAYSELEEENKAVKRELASRVSPSQFEEEISTLKHELASRTSLFSELEEEKKTLKHDLEQSRGMYMETISAAAANASKANEDIKKRLAIQEQHEELISCLQEQVRTTDKKRDQALEEAQAAKTSSESLLADLQASRIAVAEVENKEILELRENVRTGQEETARLTALLDDEESKISNTKRILEVKSDELAHSEALVQRLRTEMQSAEQRHAERIAVLSSRLVETEKTNECTQKLRQIEAEKANESAQKLRENSKVIDARLKEIMVRTEQAEAQAEVLMSELEATKQKAAQGASDTQQCTDLHAELEALKASCAAELASLTREAMKKSKIARTLLDEKDKKLEAAKEMMDDLKSELAQAIGSENSGQAPLSIEYLRNIMLRYMSFGASSMERRRLLPVICTLLDFSEEDVRKLMKGLKWEWWGGTEIMKSTKKIKPTSSTPTNERRGSLEESSDRGPLLDPQNNYSFD
eukprot:418688_1